MRNLNRQIVDSIRPKLGKQIKSSGLLAEQVPELEIVDNVDGYNKRLAYQQGFSTKHIFYRSLEVWAKRIAQEISHDRWDSPLLMQLRFNASPSQRNRLLRKLNLMNINFRTLFPDIKGSVDYARFSVEHLRRPRIQSFHGTRSSERD